jgi:hypothetical protein
VTESESLSSGRATLTVLKNVRVNENAEDIFITPGTFLVTLKELWLIVPKLFRMSYQCEC